MLVVGRFSTEKGHADLIPAVAFLTQIYKQPFRCILVGDGIERSNLERSIAAAGLTQRFLFAGHTSEVAPYYALADILVVPSLSEGSPNVVLEAMAAGLPIAATSVGGIPETVEHEVSALLVPARNPEAMAAAVARLLSQPELARRLSAEASAQCARRFSPAAYQRELLSVYSRLCPAAGVRVTAS
jgi:glycosyltransferase involved in cell wall biosynthesis